MNDPLLVCFRQRPQRLLRDPHGVVRRDATDTFEPLTEWLPFEPLHRQVQNRALRRRVILAEVVHGDRMRRGQRAGRPSLALEA